MYIIMGHSQSNPTKASNTKIRYTPRKKFTDQEIKNNIHNLFKNNNNAQFSSASDTLAFVDSGYRTDNTIHDVGNYVQNLHGGGKSGLSEELERIKEYVVQEIKKTKQSGGSVTKDYDDLKLSYNIANMFGGNRDVNENNTSTASFGGANDIDKTESDDDLDLEKLDETNAKDDEDSDVESDADSDVESDDEEIVIDADSTSSERKHKKKKHHDKSKKEKKGTPSSSESTSARHSTSEPKAHKKAKRSNRFSVSSYSQTSSQMNILPFYSSDTSSSDVKHPYARKRM